jgi:holo-[acyl-carrier protein] synthase
MSGVTEVGPPLGRFDIDRGMAGALARTASVAATTSVGSASAVGSPDVGLRVGVDVTDVAEVADSVRVFGDRYLRRIFTPHELDCCKRTGPPERRSAWEDDGPAHPGVTGLSLESLAARFAAKEAAVKVLRPTGPRPDWRSIEVRRDAHGACDLVLSGLAADLAAQAGFDRLAVSLTHHAGMAAAVVVAVPTRSGAVHPDGDRASAIAHDAESPPPLLPHRSTRSNPRDAPPMHTHRTKE